MTIEYSQYAHQNWCPESEPVTGLDKFLSALDQGWYLIDRTCLEMIYTRSGRYFHLYQCRLRKAGRTAYINIVSNPHVLTVLASLDLTVVTLYQSPEEELTFCDKQNQEQKQKQHQDKPTPVPIYTR